MNFDANCWWVQEENPSRMKFTFQINCPEKAENKMLEIFKEWKPCGSGFNAKKKEVLCMFSKYFDSVEEFIDYATDNIPFSFKFMLSDRRKHPTIINGNMKAKI